MRTTIALAVLAALGLAAAGCRPGASGIDPSIAFSVVPQAAEGGSEKVAKIAGRVTGARPGQTLSIRAHAAYLVCADICVPEEADVTLFVPVVEHGAGADPQWGAQVAQAIATANAKDQNVVRGSRGAETVAVSRDRSGVEAEAMRAASNPDQNVTPGSRVNSKVVSTMPHPMDVRAAEAAKSGNKL